MKQQLIRVLTAFTLSVAATIAALTGSMAPAAAADAPGLLDQLTVRTVSSRPEMVSGGDAIVQVRVPASYLTAVTSWPVWTRSRRPRSAADLRM